MKKQICIENPFWIANRKFLEVGKILGLIFTLMEKLFLKSSITEYLYPMQKHDQLIIKEYTKSSLKIG